jgi:threonylcarbamoyladenosine tRNA methylthiotransferase MtaB
MKTFSINTLGCKVNQYESQQVRELLERLGLRKSEPFEKPDLVVLNTCCVTHTASSKSRQYVSRIQKLTPDAALVVCGCLPTVQIGESTPATKNIHFVKNRSALAEILSHIINGKDCTLDCQSCPNNPIKPENDHKIKHKNELCHYTNLPSLSSFDGHTRAFLKVQDGCDGYCSYCIVPKTRPFVHSRAENEILTEAQALVRAGHKEIVITGINLGAYGQKSVRRKKWPNQQNVKLANLLDKIAQIPNLARIRLSSLEPTDVTPQLLDILCKYHNIMPHLHLSLQSGSDSVLKRMCRQYTTEQIREKVDMIKSRLDRPAITADIIVGFPGETDADFEQTVNLARNTGFAKMHIFRFSPRKGTAAANMQCAVSNNVIKKRSQILHDLNIELGREFRRQFLGKSANILIESYNGKLSGRCERYFMVNIENSGISNLKLKVRKNDLVKVRLVENKQTGMIGRIVS